MSEWTGVKHRRRAKQLYSYEGLFVDGSWATDIDGVLEWRDRGYVFFELKRPGVSLPNGQRIALERLVNDVRKAGKKAILLLCENDVADPDMDVKVKDCRVLKVYDGTWHESPFIYAGDVVNYGLFHKEEQEERVNNVVISGRLTRDVDLRYTQSNLACAKFSVAVDRPKRKDGQDAGTDFINCVVWGKQGENCDRFIGKGCRVIVNGRIQTGSYQKKDGTKAYTTDVVANNVEFIDFKDSDKQEQRQEDPQEDFEALNESVPF